ncbi:MAG: Maf family protein [Minisyncoccales bacterium]
MEKIILATASPYRIQTLKETGYEFLAESSNIDEKFKGRPENPLELVKTLAKLKAEDVSKNHKEGIIIGMDSIGYFNEKILEKPKSYHEALNRLQDLSGKTYSFFTGVHLINKNNDKTLNKTIETKVQMRELKEDEIRNYLDNDKEERYKTYAQGYDPINGISSSFISEIIGSPLNILKGIPLPQIIDMIKEIKTSNK